MEILDWLTRGAAFIPEILAIVRGVRTVLDNGGASAAELRLAIEKARLQHASADAVKVLDAELEMLRKG